MSEWQPIVAAPKDGEVFLGMVADIPIYSIVLWYEGRFECADDGTDRHDLTHWQPLPAPPECWSQGQAE